MSIFLLAQRKAVGVTGKLEYVAKKWALEVDGAGSKLLPITSAG